MSALDPKPTSDAPKPTPATREDRAHEKSAEKLDFAKLDLSIEKVEERIAPSETNVFDK